MFNLILSIHIVHSYCCHKLIPKTLSLRAQIKIRLCNNLFNFIVEYLWEANSQRYKFNAWMNEWYYVVNNLKSLNLKLETKTIKSNNFNLAAERSYLFVCSLKNSVSFFSTILQIGDLSVGKKNSYIITILH